MNMNDCFFGGEFEGHIRAIYTQLMMIVNSAKINSPEWNYAWDMLRSHIDHFKYRQLELAANAPQKPIEVP